MSGVLKRPEVVGSLSLTEATARNQTDARLLQQLHTIKHIWSFSLLLKSQTVCVSYDK